LHRRTQSKNSRIIRKCSSGSRVHVSDGPRVIHHRRTFQWHVSIWTQLTWWIIKCR